MLAVLFILGMLYPLNFAEIPITLLGTDQVFSSVFPDAFLLSPPNCSVYENKTATLLYTDVSTNENKTESFLVPPCKASQLFLLQNLKKGTEYIMWYQIENETSAKLTKTTTDVLDYQQINRCLEARSGAMVVITVILSLAMVILLVGLLIVIFFSG